MNHPPSHPLPRRDRLAAFTLVELLVVIGIIAVLMGILLPVVSHIKQAGYTSATANQLIVIQGGIEQYRQTFEAYPGPVPDAFLLPVANAANAGGPFTGSENLVLGLLGGLQVNPATGVISFNPTLVGSGPNSLNFLKPQRYPAFVDPVSAGLDTLKSGANWTVWSTHQNVSYPGKFTDTPAPEFVDRYPDALPILYIRARVGATGVVALNANGTTTFPANTSPAYNPWQLIPYNFPDLTSPGSASPPNTDFANPQSYFGNLADNFMTPRQKDGFLLISAGPDRRYGTADDVTNGGKLK
jgi:type II secretory pathway pseudopilin PulG